MAVCGDRPPFSNRILKVHLWEKGKNFMNKEKNIRWIPVLCFGVLMLGLGSSDSLRGIFSPVFQEHYSVGGRGLSMMVVISYVGNLLFLSVGGKMMDTFDRKKVAMGMLGIWMAAVLLNVLTDSYPMILLSMFLALGASTMLNTTVNLLTPMVCAGYAGMMVNIFFFIQGIGTSGSQFLLGRFAFSYDGWKMINGVLFAVGLVSLVLFAMVNLKPEKIKPKTIQKKKPQDMPGASIFWLLVLMMGFYFIGEHGIMNWMLTYCMNALQMPSHTASTYLSIFWGGMTVGRLVFAPVVQKLGVRKSLKYFGGAGTVLFVTGVLSGSKGVILLSSSGSADLHPLPDDGAVLPADLSSVSGCYQDRSDHQCCYHCGYCIQRRLWRTVRFYGNPDQLSDPSGLYGTVLLLLSAAFAGIPVGSLTIP